MTQPQTIESRPVMVAGSPDPETGLLSCCLKTIDLHSAHNQMMVCAGCQQTIKCFHTEKDFRNYRIFCESRGREIKTGQYKDKFIVIFYAYNT